MHNKCWGNKTVNHIRLVAFKVEIYFNYEKKKLEIDINFNFNKALETLKKVIFHCINKMLNVHSFF